MKHLRIEVNGSEWVNGDFAEITFTDGPGGVKIEGRVASAPTGNGGGAGGLLEMLAGASRNRTPETPTQRKPSPTPKAAATKKKATVEVIEPEPDNQD
jgi:hypothetical protein